MQNIITTDELLSLRADSRPSFILLLNGIQFIPEKLLRVLPKKRAVLLGVWGDKKVVVKLFYSRAASRHLKRELLGVECLKRAGIMAPDVLYYGAGDNLESKVRVIAFNYLTSDRDLSEVWYGDDVEQFKMLIDDLQKFIVRQHKAGCYHVDLHPLNFLLHDDQLYMMSFSAVRQEAGHALSPPKSLSNLASFYSQICLKYQFFVREFFQRYCAERGWDCTPKLMDNLFGIWRETLHHRMREIQKRCQRNCTGVIAEYFPKKRIFYDRRYRSQKLQDLLSCPDRYVAQGKMIKDGHTCTVVKVKVDGKWLVIKRYNIKSWRHYFKYLFKKTRAIRSWKNANLLRALGVDTPRPVAMIENRWGIFKGTSYFVAEHVHGELLDDFFSDKHRVNEEVRHVADAVVHWMRSLRFAWITHGDLKANNFILSNSKLVILDLDSMRLHKRKKSYEKYAQKDMTRFMKNWFDKPFIQGLLVSALMERE